MTIFTIDQIFESNNEVINNYLIVKSLFKLNNFFIQYNIKIDIIKFSGKIVDTVMPLNLKHLQFTRGFNNFFIINHKSQIVSTLTL